MTMKTIYKDLLADRHGLKIGILNLAMLDRDKKPVSPLENL